MTLDKIQIQGFKALENVSFEPGRINVFIGANGSGKTTILEAIGVLSAAMTDRVDNHALYRKGIRLSVPQMYRSGFKCAGSSSSISFSVEWHQDQNVYAYSACLKVPLDTNSTRGETWEYQQETLWKDTYLTWERKDITQSEDDPYAGRLMLNLGTKAARADVATMRDYAIFQPSTPCLRGTQVDPLQNELIGLCGGRLAEAIEDLLVVQDDGDAFLGNIAMEDLLELLDWADGFTVAAPRKSTIHAAVPASRQVLEFRDRFMKQDLRFTAYDASDGAMYVLFLIALAAHEHTPRIFAIDNAFHTMHPRLARAVTRMFCDEILKQKKTVFLTTQNPLVLDGLNLRNEAIRLFAVDKNRKTGHTAINRIQITPELLDSGLSLSRLWLEGRLGGVPDLL